MIQPKNKHGATDKNFEMLNLCHRLRFADIHMDAVKSSFKFQMIVLTTRIQNLIAYWFIAIKDVEDESGWPFREVMFLFALWKVLLKCEKL